MRRLKKQARWKPKSIEICGAWYRRIQG